MLRKMAAATLLLAVGSCQSDPSPRPIEYSLREIRRFGWPEARFDSTTGTSDDSGVLGQVTGLARGEDSTLYVLDAQFNRVVGFHLDGTAQVVVASRNGEGPGEFRQASSLALQGERLAVLDSELRRISIFEPGGSLTGSFRISGRSLRLAWLRDTLWVTSSARPGRLQVIAAGYSQVGDSVAGGPAPPEEEAFGSGFSLATGPGGDLLVTSARPGVWYRFEAGSWKHVGAPLYPEMSPPPVERTGERQVSIGLAQATVAGIGYVSDSLVVQRYWRFPEAPVLGEPPDRESLQHVIALFKPDGEHVGNIELRTSGLELNHFLADALSGHIFMVALEPYPQVIEYELAASGW